ncbi:G-type lectin S-receptor-like serine/threonine-protein kinase SD1-1 [Glycine soja]|uniref:non-specific serine/threonine protein kinase n=1 Tax=Glycine soja TaxID=3848 RepID=A0A445IB87_GLYSO|nr:G-type lectin S-receptor-like serine/threonine-protein kinase SD1-1 [Glycine soja]
MRRVSAWKNWDDSSPGDFTWGISLEGFPQVIMWKGSKEFYHGGHWSGLGFSGALELKANPVFEFKFVSNEDEVYYTYSLRNESLVSRIVMNQTISTRQRYIWIEKAQSWRLYASVPRDNCDFYNLCGSNGNRVIGNNLMVENNEENVKEDLELPLVDLAAIVKATDGFSINNKLGEGGFGAVYMGTLDDGHEIAVKRLSQSSGQGFNEFKNEVILIAKLQNRNLVKFLGRCIEGEEKMVIYEYMPNKSLEFFIFDHAKGNVLDWPKRFNIICGIARGLLYLHQDSRTFWGDQIEGNTRRVVGTYGYMASEYAIYGLFSVKSDVFSFGVLMLEIVSGKKNRGFSHSNNGINLIGQGWRFWRESRPLDLIDSCMENSSVLLEALCCIHIGLLCVQQNPEDRPSMSTVVVMLSSESALPQPKEPPFFLKNDKFCLEADSSTKHKFSSTNDISVTMLEPR